MHKILGKLTPEGIQSTLNCMRTTLDLPEELVTEAKALFGFKSKTDLIVYALQEAVRRRRREQLIEMFGKVKIDIDIDRSRRRPGKR
jgi:hypothetical protein